jgi:hypothetical protein
MSPLMMRIFTLVGIALAAASMQLRARAEVAHAGEAVQPPALSMAHSPASDRRPA